MKSKILIISSLFLCSCAANRDVVIKTNDVIVKTAVPVPCKIKSVEKPVMPIDSLKKTDNIFTKTKTILSEIEKRTAYEKPLETAVKECQ